MSIRLKHRYRRDFPYEAESLCLNLEMLGLVCENRWQGLKVNKITVLRDNKGSGIIQQSSLSGSKLEFPHQV